MGIFLLLLAESEAEQPIKGAGKGGMVATFTTDDVLAEGLLPKCWKSWGLMQDIIVSTAWNHLAEILWLAGSA